ncbi:TolC family protein [candidate division KSB1 bacterium]
MKKIIVVAFILALPVTLLSAQQVLTLDDCIQTALQNNPEIHKAASNLRIVKAGKLQSYSNILPSLSMYAAPSRYYRAPSTYEGFVPVGRDPVTNDIIQKKAVVTNPANTTVNYSAGLNWNQNLWDTGRWWNQIRSSEAGVRASEYAAENTVMTTVLTVKERYYELLKAIVQLSVLEEAVEVAQEQLRNSQSRYEIGTVAQIDVFKSEVNLGNNQINQLNQELVIENARNLLNIAMGRDVDTPVEIDTDTPVDVNYGYDLENLLSRGVRSHPSIMQQEYMMSQSALNVKIAKSGRYPTISWGGNYSRSNSDMARVYQNFDLNYGLNMNVSLRMNLFDGFITKGNIQRSQNQFNIDEENYTVVRRGIQSDIRNAFLQLQQYSEKLAINERIVESAREDLRLANERYRVGSGTLFETLDAQRAFTSTRYNYVRMQYDAKIAEARLEEAVGILADQYRALVDLK